MKEQFCSYEIALALKELGFDEPCMKYIRGNGFDFDITSVNECLPILAENFNAKPDCVSIPLWQQAIEWLRIHHNYHISIYMLNRMWCGDVYSVLEKCYITSNAFLHNMFNTYEEAREVAILEAIKLVKENKK